MIIISNNFLRYLLEHAILIQESERSKGYPKAQSTFQERKLRSSRSSVYAILEGVP